MSMKKNILIPLFVVSLFVLGVTFYNKSQIKEINLLDLKGDWSAKELLAASSNKCGDVPSGNVFGWAYANPIGPISLNCMNCSGGSYDCGNVGTDIAHYGVNINDDRTLSGYAWSPAIGPISFNEDEIRVTNFPANNTGANHGARIEYHKESGKAKITGWARALSACDYDESTGKCTTDGAGDNAGGWDGWIKFDGNDSVNFVKEGTVYNTIVETVVENGQTKHKILGNAWGGALNDDAIPAAVLGEIRYVGATTTYDPKNACPTEKPEANFKLGCRNNDVDDGEKCYFDFGKVVNLINDASDPDDHDCQLEYTDIKKSTWLMQGAGTPGILIVSGKTYGSFTPKSEKSFDANIIMSVEDYFGHTHEITKTFLMRKAIVADFSCCIKTDAIDCSSNSHYKKCENSFEGMTVTEDTHLFLRDSSSVPNHTKMSVDASFKSRAWYYNNALVGQSTLEDREKESVQVSIKQNGVIKLKVVDSVLDAEKTLNLNSMFKKIEKNPDFKEIPFN